MNKRVSVKGTEKKRNPLWIYQLTLFLFAFVLYGNTIPNEYCIDDNLVVYKNEQVMKGLKGIPEIFTSHYREGKKNEYGYRPIAKATYAIESQFLNQNPHVSHFINILLYTLLLLLLFKFLNTVFPDIPLAIRFIIILLYAAHPLHTEVVASLKNREELLCFIFAVSATLFLIRGISEKKKRILRIFAGLLFLACSILSKQTGMVFCIIIPFILLQFYYKPLSFKKIIDPGIKALLWKYLFLIIISFLLGIVCYYFLPVYKSVHFFINVKLKLTSILFYIIIPLVLLVLFNRKRLNYKKTENAEEKKLSWRYIYLFVFFIAILILGYSLYKVPKALLPHGDKPLYGFENPLFLDHSFYNRICLGFMGLLYYFKLIFIPWPLSFYYGYNVVPLTEISDFRVILSIIIHVALLFIAFINFRRNKIISFGILFYLIGLLMFTNWFTIIPGIIGERLIFISSFGFCIAMGGIIFMIRNRLIKLGKIKTDKLPKAVYVIISVVILVYSFQTFARNRTWKNHYTLYKTDVAHLGNSAKVNSIYADELLNNIYENITLKKPYDQWKIDTAFRHYQRAAEIYPDFFSAYTNIGTIYFTFYKNRDSAIYYFNKSLSIDSTNYEANYGIAMIYDLGSDTANALKYYEKAVRLDSSGNELLIRYANILFEKGNLEKAIALNMQIAKNDPAYALPYINVGNYYIALKDTANAVGYFEKASDLSAKDNRLNTFLSEYFRKKCDMENYKKFSARISK